jgi:formylglycine-generating enzyme required for sulfatase activity
VDADFSKLANLADERLNNLARGDSPKWIPSISAFNDGSIVTDNVGKYRPNAFGLHEMIGNAAEWTRSAYRPYPYRDDDGRNDPAANVERVVRGGSFYDRPHRATSSFRLPYRPYAKVWNTGFRIVIEAE